MKKYIAYFTSLLVCAVALGGTSLYGAAEHAQNQKNYEQLKANIQKLENQNRALLEKVENSQGIVAVCSERFKCLKLIEQELIEYSIFLGKVRRVDMPYEGKDEKAAKRLVSRNLTDIVAAKSRLILERQQYHALNLEQLKQKIKARKSQIGALKKYIEGAKSELRVSWLMSVLAWFKAKQTGPISEDRQKALRKNINELYTARDKLSVDLARCQSAVGALTKKITEIRPAINEFVQLEVQSVQGYKKTYGVDTALQKTLQELDLLIKEIEKLGSEKVENMKLKTIEQKLERLSKATY